MTHELLSYDISHNRSTSTATLEDRIGGAEVVYKPRRIAYLKNISVHPDFRGRRLGSMLFSLAVGCAIVKNSRYFEACVGNERVASMFRTFPESSLRIGEPDILYPEGGQLKNIDHVIDFLRAQRSTSRPEDSEMLGSMIYISAQL